MDEEKKIRIKEKKEVEEMGEKEWKWDRRGGSEAVGLVNRHEEMSEWKERIILARLMDILTCE